MKARTQAAKRRAKRERAAFPGLAPIQKRKKQGSARMAEIQSEEIENNLRARARQMGLDENNPDTLKEMRAQSLESGAGSALAVFWGRDTGKQLMAMYVDFCASYEAYARSVGVSCYPKSQKIEMMPNPMPEAMEYTPDLRSQDERDMAAARKWQYWKDVVERLPLGAAAAIDTARLGFVTLIEGGKLTAAGTRFAQAMDMLRRVRE